MAKAVGNAHGEQVILVYLLLPLHAQVELVAVYAGGIVLDYAVHVAVAVYHGYLLVVSAPKIREVGTYRQRLEHAPSYTHISLMKAAGTRIGLYRCHGRVDYLAVVVVVADVGIWQHTGAEAQAWHQAEGSHGILEIGIIGVDTRSVLLEVGHLSRHAQIEEHGQ